LVEKVTFLIIFQAVNLQNLAIFGHQEDCVCEL
jgi:hypothetical protein